MRILITITLMTIYLTAIGQTSIDTESKYTRSNVKGIIIQNSYPKGGGYTDATGKNFGYRIFWTRVINATSTPLELTIDFATATNLPWPYLHLFFPPSTIALNKEKLYNYGVIGATHLELKSDKSTKLQKTINPKEEYLFYTGVLLDGARACVARAGLVLKGQDLFYRISCIESKLDSASIACGQIVVK